MVRRLAQVVLALAVAAIPVVVTTSPSEARPSYGLSVPSVFSPNGDGVQDSVRVRYTVPEPTRVRLEVSRAGRGKGRVVRKVDLGWKVKGTYRWTWDGRNEQGNRIGEGLYRVTLALPDGSGVAGDRVKADTSFTAELSSPVHGERGARARVFPRSTEVADAVELTAYSGEKRLESLRLVISNAVGKVVRDADVDELLLTGGGYRYGYGRTVAWAAKRGGRPLPRGSYTAVVTGRDKAGNTGMSAPLEVWVSGDQLVWKETTTTVTPSESRVGVCAYTTANGCGEDHPCGQVVPSALFEGGLSYRPAACVPADPDRSDAATSRHMLEVPEAAGVRGLGAVRVSFVGAPTTAGGPDTGTLSVPGTTTSTVHGTSGESAWVEGPAWGEGLVAAYNVPHRAPAAVWDFGTSGTDSVDVASFTVDVRYLVVAD
ncbi:hypothetical protein F4692_001697 [Nocardioides cavernae]|uniref:FlgD/Vpr Ig-like domain-containing protein n=1 Tax=Nocardioides cavernae TaxID=1921566 RepID=A0A7Y9H3L5_9ACTN|nr:FlgD immunoglobulin-like domain containing protein [Nocardioides cavernae]NYE36564.1 hypothetical protein [Nocardioides cavernae]